MDINKYLEDRCFGYQVYSEIYQMSPRREEDICNVCKNYREPLTYIMEDSYYLPCLNCIPPHRKKERFELVNSIVWNVEDYYGLVLGDRYLQLFIVDDIYFSNTLPHNYSEFKGVLKLLELPSRNEAWFLDWKPGYPKIISKENLEGIKIVNLNKDYKITTSEDGGIIVNDYKISLIETVPYDKLHHSRYNLLNPESDRATKRLRLSKNSECVKFFNTSDPDIKSIFKITKGGEVVTDIPQQDMIVLRLVLMRNKIFMRKFQEIIFEIIGGCCTFSDNVILKNTVSIDSNKTTRLNLMWDTRGQKKIGFINISIF